MNRAEAEPAARGAGATVPTLPWTGERCVPEAMHPQSRIVVEHLARYTWAVERLASLPPHRVVLDAPCGAGYGTALLATAPSVAIAVGIDIDPATIAYARDRYGTPGRVNFGMGDLTRLRARADVVVCFEGIEHVVDQAAAAYSLYAALKPGGLLLLSTPRAGSPGAGSPYHTREFSLAALEDLFAPYLVETAAWGQTRAVGDTNLADAWYIVFEGRRKD